MWLIACIFTHSMNDLYLCVRTLHRAMVVRLDSMDDLERLELL